MAEVKVTLSEEMVKFLEGIYETQQKLAVAAEHINAASEALSKLGLKSDDVAVIVFHLLFLLRVMLICLC